MAQAAELGALAGVSAGLRGVEPHPVRASGDYVQLPRQLRHPEAVDHVQRLEMSADLLVDRYVELIEDLQRLPLGVLDIGVLKLPAPLDARHLHLKSVASGRATKIPNRR